MTYPRGYYPSEWEYFVSKRGDPQRKPDRFVLLGKTFYVDDWVELYNRFLRELEHRSPETFYNLPDTPPFHSTAAYTRRFVRVREQVEDGHGDPFEFRDGPLGPIYCKSSMWVTRMFPNICRLLEMFGIPESEMVVYLRKEQQGL